MTNATVSEMAAASAQALGDYLSIRGLKDGEIKRAFDRFEAEIREECAAVERGAIISFLREQEDIGASLGLQREKGSTARAAYGGGSLALKRVADAIERGEHLEAIRQKGQP